MAHIYNRNSNELQHVETPFNYKRGNPLPIDDYAVWTSLEDAQNYATSNPVAYVGQTLYVVDTTEKVVQAYVIKNEEGDLELQVDETLLSAKLQEVQDDVRGGVNYKGHINLKSGNYIPGLPLSAIFGIYYNIVDDDKVTLTSNYTVNNGWLYNIIVDGKYVTTDDPPITLENNDYLIIHNQSLSSIDVSSITTNTIDIIKALQEDYVRYNQIETLSSNLTGYTTNAIDTAISGLSTEKFQETNKFVKTITETSGKIDVEFGNVTSADFGSNKLKIEQVDTLSDELVKFDSLSGTVDGISSALSTDYIDKIGTAKTEAFTNTTNKINELSNTLSSAAVLVSSDIDFSYDMPTHTISFSIKDITGHVHNFSIDSAEFIEGRIVNTVNVVDVEDPEVPGTSIKALRIYWKAGEGENVYSDIPVRALAQIYKGIDGIKINSETLQISADNTIARVSTVNEIRNELTAYDNRLSNRLELNELSSSTISSHVDDIQTYVNELSGKNKIIDTITDNIKDLSVNIVNSDTYVGEIQVNAINVLNDLDQAWKSSYGNTLSGILQHFSFAEYGKVKNNTIIKITYTNINEAGAEGDRRKLCNLKYVTDDGIVFTDNDYIIIHGNAEYLRIEELTPNNIKYLNAIKMYQFYQLSNTVFDEFVWLSGENTEENNHAISGTNQFIGNMIVDGTSFVTNKLSVNADSVVAQVPVTLSSTLSVAGTSTLSSDVSALNNMTIKKDLFAEGSATISGDVQTNSNISANGTGTIGSTLSVGNNLSVAGTGTIASTLSVGNNLSVDGSEVVNSTLSVNGNTDLNGNVSAHNNLSVTGNIVNVGKFETTDNDISVDIPVKLANTLSVANNLSVTGTGTIASTLNVEGAGTFASTLSVGNNLSVDGSEVVNSTLSVNGDTNLNGNVSAHNNLSVTGNIVNVGKFETTDNDISVDIPVKLANTLSVANNLSAKNINVETNLCVNFANIKNNGTEYSLANLSTDLSTAISGKIWIDDKVANTIPNHTSDLSIVKMTKAEFDEFALTATGLNANVLYIVDSDYIDAYGQPIKNMKMTADSVVSEGATQHYVLSVKNDIDTELANIQANYTNAINDIGYNMISSDSSLSARLNRIDNYLETATNTPAGIAATTTLLATIVDTIYPVGTVVFNNTGTQPNIPGTTWTDDGMKEIDGEMLYMFSRST